MMKYPSLVGLLIAAVVIYLPIILVLIFSRRPCSEAVAIGGLAAVVCLVVDVVFPPLGLALFLTAHAFGLYLWISNSMSKKRDEDDSLPEELEEED